MVHNISNVESPSRTHRILVVDDEPRVREVVARYLHRDGYEVQVAVDGVGARQSLADFMPDLVVLDIMLPADSGLEILRDIRRHGELPVILLTARAEEADRVAGLELGADDYVVKPFSPRELTAQGAVGAAQGDTKAEPRALNLRGAHNRHGESRGLGRRHRGGAHRPRVRSAHISCLQAPPSIQPRPAVGAGLGFFDRMAGSGNCDRACPPPSPKDRRRPSEPSMGDHRLGCRISVRTVKAFAWGVAFALAAGLIVAELAMDLTPADRPRLYVVFGAMAMVTFLMAITSVWIAPRLPSLMISIRILAFAAVVMTGIVVAVSAVTMFIEPHDLNLVMVALLLGVGLGGVLAVAVAHPLTADLSAMSTAARRAGEGDLKARTNINRQDELGKTARAFDEMVSKLEQSEEERRTLFTAIGHDLRTPLSSLQAAVEALQDGVAPDPPAYLRGMSHDLTLLRHLVDDLFLLARMDAGRLELTPIEVDLAELADEAVEAATPAAADRRIRLCVQSPGRVGVVGDPAALGRVFRNLLANAVHHSPEAGEVRIELVKIGLGVETIVSDQGKGFDDEFKPRAFDRFVRSDGSRNRDSGGSGLGLAIAKGIVEAHGGTIAIEDGPGGRVKFNLPCS